MQVLKLYHRCGHPILVLKRPVGSLTEILYVDGNRPFIERKDGYKNPNVIKQCPECTGFIKMERLLSVRPNTEEVKGPSGYMPARI